MSTKNIIRLAKKFKHKYASKDSETKRMIQSIENKFPDLNSEIRYKNALVTLQLHYNTGWFYSSGIEIKDMRFSPSLNTSDESKKYIEGMFKHKLLPYLNTEGMKFTDGPWTLIFGGDNIQG